MIDERTEYLINRRLDNELTSDEQLELDKRLIRSPEARAMSEEYERFDRLARTALEDFCQATRPRDDLLLPSRFFAFKRYSTIAAAVALFAFSTSLFPRHKSQTGDVVNNTQNQPTIMASLPIGNDLSQLLSIEGPRHEREQVQKDLLGVFDQETQSVYLLEMDQQQTTVVPVSMNY
jgi:hypothetical protein